MTGSRPTRNWTPEQLVAFYERQGRPLPDQTLKVLSSLGLGNHLRLPAPNEAGDAAPSPPARRKGVNVRPILASLKAPLVYAAAAPGPALSLWFDGARLLTVNELFSIQQYRKHEVFPYKKAWQKLVKRALEGLPAGQAVPHFDGPTRIWLYRRGRRRVDLDSLPTMFKYPIDALRQAGVIPDDNPDIIVEPRLIQEVGLPTVALRLERLWDWQPLGTEGLKARWLDSVGLPAPAGSEAPASFDRIA